MRLVYSPHYDIRFFGLERLHPFDSRKYSRAWKLLRGWFGSRLRGVTMAPTRPIRREELLAVHTAAYLDRLRQSKYVAGALELPPVRYLPHRVLDWCILRPMRWATMGTIVAAAEAMEHGLAVNLSGGYHHAKPDGGEGFCIYSDIGLAIDRLRRDGRLQEDDRVAYIDLDAHQGNGVCHVFRTDNRVFIFDMYNREIYPGYDGEARDRIDCNLPLAANCHETDYLRTLKSRLPGFLDSLVGSGKVGLGIFNAGTDVYQGDPLGGLNLSAAGVLERDLFVIEQLRSREIPTVMLPSGGYTRMSYRLIAASVGRLLELSLFQQDFCKDWPCQGSNLL